MNRAAKNVGTRNEGQIGVCAKARTKALVYVELIQERRQGGYRRDEGIHRFNRGRRIPTGSVRLRRGLRLLMQYGGKSMLDSVDRFCLSPELSAPASPSFPASHNATYIPFLLSESVSKNVT